MFVKSSNLSSMAPVAAAVSELREASPANFVVQIDSFSLLDKHGIQKLETREFEAGGYMWKLVIYLNGHGIGNKGYVSVYLAMTNTSALHSNWEVNAAYSICLFNHFSDNYRYSIGRARRFHGLNPEWGFNKFISKKDLIDPSNGYIVGDKCVFGAEVFVNENKAVIECLSLIKSVEKDYSYKKDFKISNFSRLNVKWVSKEFKVGAYKWYKCFGIMGSSDHLEGTELETREASPAHFLIKIDSFSLLDKHGIQRLETRESMAGGYKWRLVIYPNGHGTVNDGKGYVSVYLAIINTTALPSNWEVNATISICLFNHFSGNYRFSQGRARRFHVLNQEWGFSKFISKKDLIDPSNGYIVDDKCVFGAEVFVNENKAVTECMFFKCVDKDPYKQKFKISNFSTLKGEIHSEKFTFGGREWMIGVSPNGKGEQTGRSLSIFLYPVVVSVKGASSERMRLCCTIRVKDQLNDHKHHQHTFSDFWFSASKGDGYGWLPFIKLSSLNDPKKGFIVNDCCIIEIELAVQAISS
ncbi:hypothetical protein CASFOL_029014 [Castilleja foliolosa]|uniref:MATH domain-containing protein n=1 Tax=Castilleja foliolosa TaxID=1961234 RepID=A0ABD3CCT9_9LAMI